MNEFILERQLFSDLIKVPEYYLSVTYRDLGKRKERWAREKQTGRVIPQIKEWKIPAKDDPYAGLIAKINSYGDIEKTAQSDFLHGIMFHNSGILSASHHEIVWNSLDLFESKSFASLPAFNALHSMRETKNGFLLASSGTDTVLELSKDGKNVLWSWWATENGYIEDSFGEKRVLDKNIDHRMVEYDTWLHTAHVNAATELDTNTILATLFMKGVLIKIDKNTGKSTTLLSGLKRPHSVRKYPNGKISIADTANGKAMLGHLEEDEFIVESSITVPTIWLQDALFINDHWMIVDGEKSRMCIIDQNSNILAIDQFDPNWYLYEALPID